MVNESLLPSCPVGTDRRLQSEPGPSRPRHQQQQRPPDQPASSGRPRFQTSYDDLVGVLGVHSTDTTSRAADTSSVTARLSLVYRLALPASPETLRLHSHPPFRMTSKRSKVSSIHSASPLKAAQRRRGHLTGVTDGNTHTVHQKYSFQTISEPSLNRNFFGELQPSHRSSRAVKYCSTHRDTQTRRGLRTDRQWWMHRSHD